MYRWPQLSSIAQRTVDVSKAGRLSALYEAVEAKFGVRRHFYTLVEGDRVLGDMDASLESLCVCEGTEVTLMPVDATWANLVRVMLNVHADLRDCEDASRNTPLMLAIIMGDLELIEAVTEKEQDFNLVNSDGKSALMLAVEQGLPLEVIKLLLDKGAETSYSTGYSHLPINVLHRAGKLNYKEAVHLLIEHGADVNANEDPTILQLAIENEWPDTALLLISKGANVRPPNSYTSPPLMMAMKKAMGSNE
eukprot:TRINITY_DN4137_c0_g2_i1.p1 TRINITY_DN4137_c0_g2~~TRINITY_DN4137_c0_g2_i1.p1  ORF type:complete len:250 (+),score=40.67 TRINITY_DN4137_c0_g2_i1:59-808(+)